MNSAQPAPVSFWEACQPVGQLWHPQHFGHLLGYPQQVRIGRPTPQMTLSSCYENAAQTACSAQASSTLLLSTLILRWHPEAEPYRLEELFNRTVACQSLALSDRSDLGVLHTWQEASALLCRFKFLSIFIEGQTLKQTRRQYKRMQMQL